MSWEETLDYYGALIEERLQEYVAEVGEEASDYHPFVGKAYSDLEKFVLRKGKRLASCSTLLAYKGYAGEFDDQILDVCVGVELYRHCILVHDDLIDMDDLRRKGRTLHKVFAKNYDARFGEGTALFVGNIAYILAMRAIMDSSFPEEKIAEVLSLLTKGYREVNESQILDLLFEYEDVDVDEWRVMASRRAASLFKVTILVGAILGGAPEGDLGILKEAAENVGYSFDIQDDIIDTYADEERYGRAPCGDIALGKKPLHVIFALNSKDREKSRKLRGLLGKENFRREEIDPIRSLIEETGGLDAAKKVSKKHAEGARTLIARTNLSDDAKEFFNSFIAYVEGSLDWYR